MVSSSKGCPISNARFSHSGRIKQFPDFQKKRGGVTLHHVREFSPFARFRLIMYSKHSTKLFLRVSLFLNFRKIVSSSFSIIMVMYTWKCFSHSEDYIVEMSTCGYLFLSLSGRNRSFKLLQNVESLSSVSSRHAGNKKAQKNRKIADFPFLGNRWFKNTSGNRQHGKKAKC